VTDHVFDHRVGGGALIAGFVLSLGILLWAPSESLGGITAGVGRTVYFLVLPLIGIIAGVYAVYARRYYGVVLFVAANYLGVFGLTLAIGISGLSMTLRLGGAGMFFLSVIAVLAGLFWLVDYFEQTSPLG
jgi:hypothetical protein